MTYKNDTLAKKAYIEKLLSQGFDTAVVKAEPADIVATKNNENWYFEIKMTSQTGTYFGAATLTEWEQAFKTPDRYFFVVAIKKDDNTFDFREYTPFDFMKCSTIPPFKVYFNLDLKDNKKKTQRNDKKPAIALTEENFNKMNTLFQEMRKAARNHNAGLKPHRAARVHNMGGGVIWTRQ